MIALSFIHLLFRQLLSAHHTSLKGTTVSYPRPMDQHEIDFYELWSPRYVDIPAQPLTSTHATVQTQKTAATDADETPRSCTTKITQPPSVWAYRCPSQMTRRQGRVHAFSFEALQIEAMPSPCFTSAVAAMHLTAYLTLILL